MILLYILRWLKTHDNSFLRIVESLYELYGGTLATAWGADEGEGLSRGDTDVQPLKYGHRGASRVVEVRIVEDYCTSDAVLKAEPKPKI